MLPLITGLKDTPIPTILVLAGIVFILLAIAGSFKPFEIPPLKSLRERLLAGIGGTVFLIAGLLIYLLPISPLGITQPSPGTPTATPTPTSTPSSLSSLTPAPTSTAIRDLDDNTNWAIFNFSGKPKVMLANVSDPSNDGSALKVSFSSQQSYSGVLVFQNLPDAPKATTFELDVSFYFTDAKPIQALAFTINKLVDHQRWEWALQWQNISGATPSWRAFDRGTQTWQETGVTQNLSPNMWHTFQMKGDLVNGQAHYISFSCDGSSNKLGQTFGPATELGDRLSVGVELDSDQQKDPYVLYVDGVDFIWS